MANTRVYSRSFAGGELSPEMFGRIDDAKFQSGAASLRNVVVTPTGAAKNRAGLAYVNATKNNGVARLIPFTFSLNQTMVIELGNQYARFHTNGETLQYSTAGVLPWIESSPGDISYTLTTPSVITWTGHGLATGDPIRFYVCGTAPIPPLPGGLQLGYTYTVKVIDANTFTLLDASGNPVGLTGSGSGGSGTNYPGTGSASVSLSVAPNENGSATSGAIGGLANTPVSGGIATLNLDIEVSINSYVGGGSAYFEYSTDGTSWNSCGGSRSSGNQALSVSIPITNLDLLQLRVRLYASAGTSGYVSISAQIASWSVTVPNGSGSSTAPLKAYRYYSAGDMVSYGGTYYTAVVADSGGMTTPGTNAQVWYPMPADLSYEIPTPYAAADLFAIHYVQSADVMTLVHPNYPPQALERLSAAAWTMVPIVFGLPLGTPQNPAVAASPGYLAQIASIADGTGTQAGNALITTVSNHTLALGDGVYVANLTFTPASGTAQVLDGFYLVSKVPSDSSGNLINNELYLMDYSGNNLAFQSGGSYSSGATIQYGTKIFNITSNYAVQAVASDNVSTGLLSATVSVLNNLDVPGSYNTISWSAVAGAQTYQVYKQFNGLWGFIGSTKALSFVDNNIAPDLSITPGTPYGVFSKPGDYPGAVCYFQQRKCFAGTLNAPQNAWMSNSGTENMFSYSLPSLSTDAVVFRVAALQADAIQHLAPMMELILLTSESEYALVPVNSSAITPSSVSVNPQSYIGASAVQPTIINTSMVYAAARGGHVRELGYAWTVNGYMTNDLSLRAAHLFDNMTIVDQAYSKSPWPIVWFVSSGGNLLGFTYIPEEQFGAWHHHDTEGRFESIACVSEGSEDVLYAVVNRTVNGQTVRYVERMASRFFTDQADAFFVDSGATFDGTNTTATKVAAALHTSSDGLNGTYNLTASAAIFAYPATTDAGSSVVLTGSDGNEYWFKILTESSTTSANALCASAVPAGVTFPATAGWAWARTKISGLTWLEGCTVSVLADGGVQAQQVVKNGAITLGHAAVVVQVGLPYLCDLQTLPAVMQVDGYGQGRMKNVNKAWVKVYQSSGILVGPDEDHLTEIPERSTEPWGSPPSLKTAELLVMNTPSWQESGQVLIRQQNPLPLEVVGLTLEVAIGG